MKTIALIIIALTLKTLVYSQTLNQTIRGRVTDKDSKQPLPGATVLVQNTNPLIGVVTNIEGEYEIKNLPIGRQSLTVSYMGYHTTEVKNLFLQSGKELVVNIELVEKVENLQGIEIKAYTNNGRAINEMAPVSARSFSVEQTERFAGSLGDPARMVGNYAGVVMQNDTRNDIIIRGNSPIGVIWRLDDIEIPNPNHFGALGTTGGPVSMLNNNLLTNSDFFTGAFPAQFSNGISGAFDLNMRSGNNQKTEYTGQIGFNGFEFGIEGPFSKNSKASYLINGRYSTLALMHKIGFGTGTGNAIPYYQDLTFKIDLPTKKAGKFSAFGIFGNSSIDLGADINDTVATGYNSTDTRTRFSAGQMVVGISNLYFFNQKTRIKTTISGQKANDKAEIDFYRFAQNRIQENFRSEKEQKKLTLASHLKSKINNKNNFGIGFYVDYNKIDFTDSIYLYDFNKFVTLHNTKENFLNYRAYTQYQYKFTDVLSLFSGINILANSINADFSIEPRTGIEWKLNDLQTISLGYGKHSQMQPASVYFLEYNDTVNHITLLTNKNLGLTKADHFVLGYSYQLNENLRFKTETYYQNIYNIPVSQIIPEFSMLNAGEFFNIPNQDSLVNSGKGRNYGIEITIEKSLKDGYYILFTTSLFDSKYKGTDNIWRNTAFNSNYIFNLLAGYEFKIKSRTFFTFDVKTVYSGGKRYIPIDIQKSMAKEEAVFDYTNAYKEKFDDYFRMDIRIGYKINGRKINQEWALDLQNVTSHHSPFMQGYDSNKKKTYLTYQQGFFPMMLYRIQF
jgi:hypothetical protein